MDREKERESGVWGEEDGVVRGEDEADLEDKIGEIKSGVCCPAPNNTSGMDTKALTWI